MMKSPTVTTAVVAFFAFALLALAPYRPCDLTRADKNLNGIPINSEGSTVLMDKPYFSMTLDMNASAGYLLLNGELLYGAAMMPIKFDVPVNHLIKKGDNELRFILAPMDEEGNMGTFPKTMRCSMTLKVRRSGTSLADNVTVASLSFDAKGSTGIEGSSPEGRLDSKKGFKPAKNGDVKVGKVKKEPFQIGTMVTRIITLPDIGLPEWKFFKSDDITSLSAPDIDGQMDDQTIEKLKKELLPIYRKIWSALEARDLKAVLPLYEERNKEIDAAFHKKPGETGQRLAKELQEKASDTTIKLFPITEDNVVVHVSDNNKLVKLTQNNDKALICFSDPVNHVGYYYDLVLRKSGNKWIITR